MSAFDKQVTAVMLSLVLFFGLMVYGAVTLLQRYVPKAEPPKHYHYVVTLYNADGSRAQQWTSKVPPYTGEGHYNFRDAKTDNWHSISGTVTVEQQEEAQ